MSWQTVFQPQFTKLDSVFRLYFPKSVSSVFDCEKVIFKIDPDKPKTLGLKIPTSHELRSQIKPLTAKVTEQKNRGVRIAIPLELLEHLGITKEHVGLKFKTTFSRLSRRSGEKIDFITIDFSSSM